MESKILAMQRSLFAKVAYPAKFMAWTCLEYEVIDRVISAALRKITRNMQTFPEALLYASKQDGGFGFTKWSDSIQLTKNRIIQYGQHGAAGHHVQGNVVRIFETAGIPLLPRTRTTLRVETSDRCWWASCVVEWIVEVTL